MVCSSPEIVEVGDDCGRDGGGGGGGDVYVAVGKDDLDAVKWVLDHGLSPGARVFLIHVFPPLTYILTPVGRLSRSQLSKDQVRVYVNEENNKRKNLLHKYITLCNDAKVPVETMLVESNATTKAILDLIPVLNITQLVIGTKTPPFSRRLMKKTSKGEVVKKNAPDCCEVTIVHDGKKVTEKVHCRIARSPRRVRKNFVECGCFQGKFFA